MTEPPRFTRKECPLSAEFALAMRDAFGNDQVQILGLREGPVELGAPDKPKPQPPPQE